MKKEALIRIWGRIAAFVIIGSYTALVLFLFKQGAGTLGLKLFFGSTPPLAAVFRGAPVWEGIWAAFAGSMLLLALTMAMVLVPGIGCGIYLARVRKNRIQRLLSTAIDLVAGVPSIVMGLFGFVLIILLRHTIMPEATTCIALSAFCLALLVLPSLTITTKNSIESIPARLEETGLALGMTEGQILFRILLPAAAQGIIGGVILALGRAVEDTAVIMLTGAVVNAGIPEGLASKYEALPFLIYYTAAQYVDEAELARGFGTALILFGLSSVALLIAGKIERITEKRWKGTE